MGKSTDKTTRSPLKTKVVRSQKILPSPVASNDLHEESEESVERAPLPRSHTPGHLASSSHDRRRKQSDLSIRQQSLSTSQVSSQGSSRPNTSSEQATGKLIASQANGPNARTPSRDRDAHTSEKRPAPSTRSTSTGVARPPISLPQVSQSSSTSGASPGTYTAFPPPQTVKDAPDLPAAPASGMYWSKAMTSGAPHSSLRAHATTLVGSNIYVFGGCDARTCFNELYIIDADSFHWCVPYATGENPKPLRAMTCTAVGKKLVIFGGGDGPAYYNDIYVLDTTNVRWSKPRILGDKFPSKRRAHTACLYKNGIYVFGGGDGVRALNDIWRLDVSDTNKMSWKLISGSERGPAAAEAYRPKARGYHTANMVGSKLIIFGGSDGGECFDDVWVYDVESHFWKAVSIPVTYRRLSHTATIVGSYLFVIGGHDGNEYSNDVLLLNLVNMTWDKRRVYGKAPSGRGYHGTVLYDSRLYVIGGFDGNEVFGDVRLLELAVHAYYSQISHFTIEV